MTRGDVTAVGVLAALIALAPLVASGYQLSILISTGLYGIATIGLVLLVGLARQVSLGHAAFFGLGAYVSGLLATRAGISPWLTIPAGALAVMAVAYVVGRPVLRLHGHYLAMATLGLGIVFQVVLNEWVDLTRGPSGFGSIPTATLPLPIAGGETASLYLVWLAALAVLALSLWLVRSSPGRALRAIGDSEVASELLGLHTADWKLRVFTLSGAYAGLAGALYANYVTFLSPQPFGFIFSLELLVMAVVGGLASVWGGMVGAFTLVVLTETLRRSLPEWLPGSSGELELVLFGVALAAMVLLRPTGLVGLAAAGLGRARSLRASPATAEEPLHAG